MASVKVLLITWKVLKNGENPILLRVIKDRKQKYVSTGKSCSPNLWDEAKGLPKKKHPLYTELCVLINKKILEANKLIMSLETEDQNFSAPELQHKLKKKSSNKTIFAYFDEVLSRLEQERRIGYANIFKSTRNSLSNYTGTENIRFNEVHYKFITEWERGLTEKGVSLNAIFVYHRTFKTLLNYAKKDGLVKAEYNPYAEISFSKFRRIKTQKRAISKEQIQRIAELEFSPETSLFDAKNYFLFSYLNRGINFVDMAFLKWTDFREDRFTYVRRKTKERFNIGLIDQSKAILEHYRPFRSPENGDFVFPILSNKYETPRSIDNRLDRVIKIVNDDLKKIGEKAGIEEKLTTYVARHSYATVLKKSGVSTSIISEAMGHDSEKTTQIYLDSFENSTLDDLANNLL